MSIRVFTSKALRQQLNLEECKELASDFKVYKTSGFPPDTFGRDAPYDDEKTWPLIRQEQVSHIHLADASTAWPRNMLQYRRTSNKSHLVYCKGSMRSDIFLLILLLRPDAHKMCRNPQHMEKIGLIAQDFRNRF